MNDSVWHACKSFWFSKHRREHAYILKTWKLSSFSPFCPFVSLNSPAEDYCWRGCYSFFTLKLYCLNGEQIDWKQGNLIDMLRLHLQVVEAKEVLVRIDKVGNLWWSRVLHHKGALHWTGLVARCGPTSWCIDMLRVEWGHMEPWA